MNVFEIKLGQNIYWVIKLDQNIYLHDLEFSQKDWEYSCEFRAVIYVKVSHAYIYGIKLNKC